MFDLHARTQPDSEVGEAHGGRASATDRVRFAKDARSLFRAGLLWAWDRKEIKPDRFDIKGPYVIFPEGSVPMEEDGGDARVLAEMDSSTRVMCFHQGKPLEIQVEVEVEIDGHFFQKDRIPFTIDPSNDGTTTLDSADDSKSDTRVKFDVTVRDSGSSLKSRLGFS